MPLKTKAMRVRTQVRGIAPVPPKHVDPFYQSPEFAEWRRIVLRRSGGVCESPTCTTPGRGFGQRLYPDHRVELKDGGEPLDVRNGWALCASCHGKKTHAERARRMARPLRAQP